MSPQFVDFNGDGRLDIVAGSFGGSPYVSYGEERGFAQPVLIRDANGVRVALNMYWDHDEDHWVWTQQWDAPGTAPPEGQCTSAIAFDWDADGDLDLLLGDYKTGRIYRRTNEGTAREPRFSSVNVAVLAGDAPLVVPGHVATLRPFDWDRDGRLDLVVGSMGEKNDAGTGGGVYVYRNTGEPGEPRFGAPLVLVPPGVADVSEPSRPDEGLYPEVGDLDGDGALDLLVGGVAFWKVPERELSDSEQALAKTLTDQLADVRAASAAIRAEIEKAVEPLDKPAAERRREQLQATRSSELRALARKRIALELALDPLTPGLKERHFVWWYRGEAAGGR